MSYYPPEAMQESAGNLADRAAKVVRVGLGQVYEHGYLLWDRQPASVRLDFYRHIPTPQEPWGTLPQDVPLILAMDYLDLYKAGLLPAPMSPTWRLFLSLPGAELDDGRIVTIFHEYAKDFRQLVLAEAKKLGLIDTVTAGGGSPSSPAPAAPTLQGAY